MISISPNGLLWQDPSERSSLRDNILLSLHTPLGSFWQDPLFGSELHQLRRELLSSATPSRADAMVMKCIEWMFSTDRIVRKTVSVSSSILSPGRLRIPIYAEGRNGVQVELETFVPVGVLS